MTETSAAPEMARPLRDRLSSPELRKVVERFVRRRVPEPEVDDLVQTVLLDALASKSAPDEDEALRKWLVGITRHKVADFHRRGSRGRLVELPEQLEGEAVAPQSAHEWADWAEKQTGDDPDAKRTLDWMARESVGEKLAHIAEQERLPATQVRQRVSRMRRWMKQQWAAELAAVAAVLLLALVAWRLLREPEPVAKPAPDVIPDVVAPEIARAGKLRAEAEGHCDRGQWRPCLDKLEEARGLDPDRADEPKYRALEQLARDALKPPPPIAPTTKDVPTTPSAEPSASPSIFDKKSAPPSKKPRTKPVPTPTPKPSLPSSPLGDFKGSGSEFKMSAPSVGSKKKKKNKKR